MSRQNIFNTFGVASVMPPSSIDELLKFLINNRQHILPAQKSSELFRTRFSGHTATSEIVHRIVAAKKEQAFSLIRIPAKTTSVSEVVDMTFIPFDVKQMTEVVPSYSKTLSVIPELSDKLIVNVTDITKANGELSSVELFHWRIVRDFLSRNYHQSSGSYWISPALVRYVAKVYSMTIGGQLARAFGLTASTKVFIQTVFALYYVGKMTSPGAAPDFVKTHAKGLGHYNVQEIQQILALIEDTLNKKTPETLNEVLQIIDTQGVTQLTNRGKTRLDRAVLNTAFRTMASETYMSTIALEYPPYMLFMILLALSNVRNGLTISMKTMGLVKEGQDVIEQLLRSPSFLSGI